MADNCLPTDVNGGKIIPKRRVKNPEGAKKITEARLRDLGAEGLHADDPYYGWGDDNGWLLAWYEPDNRLSIYGQDLYFDPAPTMDDVERLCLALRISSPS